MYPPLLATKLYIPKPQTNLVHRPRLFKKLDEGLQGGLTLLSAPPGFGKTTLLSDWIERSERPVAWISLNERDNDPVRFVSYLITAIKGTLLMGADLDLGDIPLALLYSQQPNRIEAALTMLINEVAELELPAEPTRHPIVLILDDYHVINEQAVHETVTLLLRYLPAQLHLVITSRADPDLPLPRLRIRGQVTELRAADLRFTSDEAFTFLQETTGLSFSPADVLALEERTEGWIAGLQVAALSMKGREDIPAFIESFTGSNRYILDYLIEEVLERQPAEIQAFLLQTAVLDRLSGPLCDALTGQADGQGTLEDLDRANMFLVHLDDERKWYRYHHLFADFLRAHLAKIQPELVPELHRRAAYWLKENDLPAGAVNHALAAEDFDLAELLIEQVAQETIQGGEWGTLQGWLDGLPEERLRANPRLCLAQAWASLFTASAEGTESWLEAAEAGLPILDQPGLANGAGVKAIHGQIGAIRATIAANMGDREHTIALGKRALALLPEEDLFLRTAIILAMGYAYRYKGDVPAAKESFKKVVSLSQITGNRYQMLDGLCNLANMQMLEGRQLQAQKTIRRATEVTILPNDRPSAIASEVFLIKAVHHYKRNELAEAEEHIGKSLSLNRQQGISELEYAGIFWLSVIRRAQGDLAAAREHMRKAEHLARQTHNWRIIAHVAAGSAHLSLYEGDNEAAAQWAKQVASARGSRPLSLPRIDEFETIVQAQISLALDQPAEAIALLESRLPVAKAAGRLDTVYKMMAFQSVAEDAIGDKERAMAILKKLLPQTAPQGYVRLYLDAGPAMAILLSQLASSGFETDDARHLLFNFEKQDRPSPVETRPALPTPLSARELEVLALIKSGHTNKEIAEELVISIGTVKRHISNMYRKLNVGSRTQALAKAKEFHIFT